jgi:hypothetical protein
MKNLAIFVAVAALAGFGFGQPASASPPPTSASIGDADDDASPDSLDITDCAVSSDGSDITLTMELDDDPRDADNNAKWLFHLDYTDTTDQDGNATDEFPDTPDNTGCLTTSDDTCKVTWKDGPGVFKVTGPCDCEVTEEDPWEVECMVAYGDLDPAVSGDDPLLAWCNTQRKGLVDRAPFTLGTDSCSKPQTIGETLEIQLAN